jgi:hypothetical protein
MAPMSARLGSATAVRLPSGDGTGIVQVVHHHGATSMRVAYVLQGG